jgi:hypothetical protein
LHCRHERQCILAVLTAACVQCLDPTLSRAPVRAVLQGLSTAEKDLAIARMQLPPEHPLAMPPACRRVLRSDVRDRAIATLRE